VADRPRWVIRPKLASTPVTSTLATPAAITRQATPARIRPTVWAVTSGAAQGAQDPLGWGEVQVEPVLPESGLGAARARV